MATVCQVLRAASADPAHPKNILNEGVYQMGKLLTGKQLRSIFDYYCPFDEDGKLRPEDERVTLCANNSNNWWQTRAFVQAAAQGDQSPMVIQFSYNANRKIGGDPGAIFVPEGVSYHANPVTNSAQIMSDWLEMEVDAWGADFVAASLDHGTQLPAGQGPRQCCSSSGRRNLRCLHQLPVQR